MNFMHFGGLRVGLGFRPFGAGAPAKGLGLKV